MDESAEILKLNNGSLCFVGNFDGGLFSGPSSNNVGPLGLNIPPVAELLHTCASPLLPTGAAHLRWGENQFDLRSRLGHEVIILAFARQTFRHNSIGGIEEDGIELAAYVVRKEETFLLSAHDRAALFDMSRFATVRVRPVDSSFFRHGESEELRLISELRRPSEEGIREGVRYAVWPILALHLSS